MNKSISKDTKEKIVYAINNGLYEAQNRYSGHELINNAKHFVKLDDIANSVIDTLKFDINFKIFIIKRGSYNLPLFYDEINDILFSLMSYGRFKQLLNRKDFSKVHYLDILTTFNDNLHINNKQLTLFDHPSRRNLYIIKGTREEIIQRIGKEPRKYMTIVFDMEGFKLFGVEAIFTSANLEVFYKEDWSDLIVIDYNALFNYDIEEENNSDNLEITIKPHISRNDDITEEEIIPKIKNKINRSNR